MSEFQFGLYVGFNKKIYFIDNNLEFNSMWPI